MTDFVKVRACTLSLPFTTAEWRTDNAYSWSILCPAKYITDTFGYISKHTSGLKGELTYDMLDHAAEFKQIISDQMFDETQNRWRFEPRISLGLLRTSFDTVRLHCEYYRSGNCTYESNGQTHPCKVSTCAFTKKSERQPPSTRTNWFCSVSKLPPLCSLSFCENCSNRRVRSFSFSDGAHGGVWYPDLVPLEPCYKILGFLDWLSSEVAAGRVFFKAS